MAATQTVAAGRNNFALLDDYAQERLCRGTLDLIARIRKDNPALWRVIQKEAREMEARKC